MIDRENETGVENPGEGPAGDVVAPAPTAADSGAPSRKHHLIGVALLLVVIAFGTIVRVNVTLADTRLDLGNVEGVLKSDPALIYYFTERIAGPEGGLSSFDPCIEHPSGSHLFEMFTIAQEYAIAWCYRLFGFGSGLPLFCVIMGSLFASLSAVGVYLLALELTGRVRWALFAVILFAFSFANYRTLTFILVREDFCLLWFSLHLALLARSVRTGGVLPIAAAALALVAALATWHAMGFVVTLEALCIFCWYLRSGQNPFAAPRAWIFTAILVLASLAIPVLRAKGFIFSLPMQFLFAMQILAFLARPFPIRLPGLRVALALAVWGGCLTACLLISSFIAGGGGDYSHVFQFMIAKLRFLGERPADPGEISFDVRLLWQGPFATGSVWRLALSCCVGLVLLSAAVARDVPRWIGGKGDGRVRVLVAFGAIAAVGAYLIQRLMVLPGLVVPVVGALILHRAKPRFPAAWMAGPILLQLLLFGEQIADYETTWYREGQIKEIRHLTGWIGQNIPKSEPIVADFVNSTAILAHCGNPIVLQPKYETERSRRLAEKFFTTFFQGSLDDFRRLIREDFESRFVLIDRTELWGSRYLGGLPLDAARPRPGSAAWWLMSPDSAEKIRGRTDIRLVYQSPKELPSQIFRLYEMR